MTSSTNPDVVFNLLRGDKIVELEVDIARLESGWLDSMDADTER